MTQCYLLMVFLGVNFPILFIEINIILIFYYISTTRLFYKTVAFSENKMSKQLKQRVQTLFKLNGLQLSQEAAVYLTGLLAPVKDVERNGWIDK